MPTERANLVVEVNTDSAVQAKKDIENLAPAAKKADTANDNFRKTLDKTSAALKKQETAALTNGKAANKLTGAFRVQKGALQNTAFQFQDLQVQMQGGVNASRALSQQLPQMLGAFGAGGAILGVFAGAASIAFAPLIDGLFTSKKATKDLALVMEELDKAMIKTTKGTIGLSKELIELAKISNIAALAQVKESVLSAEDSLKKLRKEIVKTADDMGYNTIAQSELVTAFENGEISATKLQESYDRLFNASSKSGDEFRKNRKELAELTAGFASATKKVNDLKKIEEELSLGRITDAKAIEKTIEDNKKLSDSRSKIADLEAERIRKSTTARIDAAQTNIYALEDGFRTQDEIITGRYNTQLAKINAAEQLQLDTEKSYAQLRLDNQEQYNNSAKKLDANRASALSGFFGQSAAIFEQGLGKQNALTKVAFAAQKLLAIPQMLVATETGAAQALALGPIAGPPLAALVKGLGYASIGVVAGTTLAGRAQGGQVRAGQPYKVGEYGEEMFVPNSSGSIVPNNKMSGANSGGPIQVVNNIKVIGGSQDAQVTTTSRQVSDVKMIQDIVVDMMTRPNSPGRAGMSSNSNLVNRGSR